MGPNQSSIFGRRVQLLKTPTGKLPPLSVRPEEALSLRVEKSLFSSCESVTITRGEMKMREWETQSHAAVH